MKKFKIYLIILIKLFFLNNIQWRKLKKVVAPKKTRGFKWNDIEIKEMLNIACEIDVSYFCDFK